MSEFAGLPHCDGRSPEVSRNVDPRCIHDVFREAVQRFPDRIAVACGESSLTYRELDRKSDRLARHLSGRGVELSSRVGLCVDRSPDLLTAILGVLKTGGCYVPIDPTYPDERKGHILEDCQATCFVTDGENAGRLAAEGVSIVDLGDEAVWEGGADGSPRPEPGVEPDDLAYMIYTSGSTGKPKGTLITHRNVVRLFTSTDDWFGFNENDVWTLFHSYAFDFSVWEIWGALFHGGRLVIVPWICSRSPEEFHRLLVDEKVTVLNQTPSAFRQLIREDESHDTDALSLRYVVFGGEALEMQSLRPWFDRHGDCSPTLVNMYGITETTVHVTYRALSRDDLDSGSIIGVPIPDLYVHLLDEKLNPVKAGETGEIFVGGEGVGLGYWRRDELTRERFISDPFSKTVGGVLYRSGDLACRTGAGELKYLGRIDHQVKIRGHRVELGEIESCLCEQREIREAIVIVREDRPGDQRLVAYLVMASGSPDERALRENLRKRLPVYMVPSTFVTMDVLPLTEHGKVDRRELPAPPDPREVGMPSSAKAVPGRGVEATLRRIWGEILGDGRIGVDDNFFDIGGHSLLLFPLQQRIAEELGKEVSVVDLLRFTTIRRLVEHLGARESQEAEGDSSTDTEPTGTIEWNGVEYPAHAIAITGMSGRFPGAPDVERFWTNLKGGVESIRTFSRDELRASGIPEQALDDPDYVRARAILTDVEFFDAAFFDINPFEARLMDPQHRVFLECAWEALEDAACDPLRFKGRIGVYAGQSINSYLLANLCSSRAFIDEFSQNFQAADFLTHAGNDKDFLATRVAYKLNLRGPAVTVQCACSTSLVAVVQACRALETRDCDMALAGGVSISLPQERGYRYDEGSIISRDGHCRPFDAQASGTVFGSGCGVVALKRLADAIRDGDPIDAVVLGSAFNNDGSGKVSYMAPSVDGQVSVIRDALRRAKVDPSTVSYVETHGTGTPLGDPIEITALRSVFEKEGFSRNHCGIGSVKSSVGHLEIAAGVTSFIKTTLALKHRILPPILHYKTPNPNIDFENSPFYVVDRPTAWDAGTGPRRAGVSAFGVGGTNAHVVLQEAAAPDPACATDVGLIPLCLSARTPEALGSLCRQLADHLENAPSASMADVAWTLLHGRARFDVRCSVAADDVSSAVTGLRDLANRPASFVRTGDSDESVVFSFPGQGAQHVGMARRIYGKEPLFREMFDRCCDLLTGEIGLDLRELIFGDDEDEAARLATLQETRITQPALFAVEYSLARFWMSRGVEPVALVGHSVGEYVAACLAGVFSLEDGLKLIAARGRLLQSQPEGAMLVVRKGASEVASILPKDLVIATDNSPTVCVVAGTREAVDAFVAECERREIVARKLSTSHAFHSPLVAAAGDMLAEVFRGVKLNPPTIPIVSNLSGGWLSAHEATDPEYWADHLRRPVRFSVCVETLIESGQRIFLECGPGRGLSSFVSQHAGLSDSPLFTINSLPGGNSDEDDRLSVWEAMGRLWQAGATIDWSPVFGGGDRRRVHLPTYAFDRQRFWVDPPVSEPAGGGETLPETAGFAGNDRDGADSPSDSAGTERSGLVGEVCQAFTEISGTEISPDQTGRPFLELGFDSLFLTQVGQQIKRRFGTPVTFKQLMDELNSIDALAGFLAEQLGLPGRLSGGAGDSNVSREDVKGLGSKQLDSLEEQLDLMERATDAGVCPCRIISGENERTRGLRDLEHLERRLATVPAAGSGGSLG